MKRLVIIVVIAFWSRTNSFAQATAVDVFANTNITKEDSIVKIEGGCIDYSKTNNHAFSYDSVLDNFYKEIERTRRLSIGIDTISYIRDIFSRSQYRSSTVCFLPFLRIFDKKADEVYHYTCFESPYRVPHKVYCEMPGIQFIVLFVMQFTIIQPYTLDSKNKFEKILLRKSGDSIGKAGLTQDDYNTIYNLYMEWFTNHFINSKITNKSPLDGSKYEWIIHTSPRLTKRKIQWLKNRRKYP